MPLAICLIESTFASQTSFPKYPCICKSINPGAIYPPSASIISMPFGISFSSMMLSILSLILPNA